MRGTRRFALLGATFIALGSLVLPSHLALAARPSVSRLAAAPYGTNLIRNGNAEAAPGATGDKTTTVPDFTTTSNFTTSRYTGGSGDLSDTSPGPADRGANYFYGGPDNPKSSATQLIDLSADAAAIDQGTVMYRLSAWLGGLAGQDDNATLTATFEDQQGQTLGTARIGPIMSKARGNASELLYRQATGAVPTNTRQVKVVLLMTRVGGSDNDGMADDLSLVLTALQGNPSQQGAPALVKTASAHILVTASGMTLYVYAKDQKGASTCTGKCASFWPPLLVRADGKVGPTMPGVMGKFGEIQRAGGTHQLTYDGAPLYTFAADKKPGDMNGQGVGGVWWAVVAPGM